MPDNKSSSSKLLTPLAAWALAFGCAVGWDAPVMPWTTFLPKAGPVGAILGLLLGGLAMAAVGWNYHYMINRSDGGVYAYANEAFGCDHGFLCGWFLLFTYAAIVWADSTAITMIVRYMLGDTMRFGFKYEVSGYEVCFGDVLTVTATACLVGAVCVWRRLSFRVQTVLAVAFAVCFAVCFAGAAIGHEGGLATMGPAFSPSGGSVVAQVLRILSVAPWLFVGFESISSMSGECAFPRGKSFAVIASALVTSVVAYIILTAIPVLALDQGCASWTDALSRMGDPDFQAFDTAGRSLGPVGPLVVCIALVGAVFTNLFGNTIVASRLIASMADDGALPRWFGCRNADNAPRNAILVVAALAVPTAFLGQTVIGIILDTALVGATIAYAYTSAATFKIAHREGDRLSQATGLCGIVVSMAMVIIFVASGSMMASESYLVLVFWCIAGLTFFLFVFKEDTRHRFGRSSVVWTSALAVILLTTVMWIRQTMHETTDAAFSGLNLSHEILEKIEFVNGVNLRNNIVQMGIVVFAVALVICLSSILRRRERQIEQEKMRARSYFFSTVSHDIRTPLNAIIGFSEMLRTGFTTKAEHEQAIDSILVSGRTLLALINDVLDLSKLESGKMDVTPEPTDCPRLLQGVVDSFRIAGGKPGLELRCVADPMPPLMLDPQRLRQIVFNLVGNAVKFTDRGHVEIRCSYTPAKDSPSGDFRLSVEDTGCGIGADDIQHLGTAYVQVGAGRSRNGGTGLGLAICRQLAVAMGGTLDVESELGRGTTFTVSLRNVMSAAPAPDPRKASDTDEKEEAGPKTAEASSSSVRRILLVDDSKLNLMVLKSMLKNAGDFETEIAMDGREALALLERKDAKPFDLVLTDLWMPNLDGKGLVKAIRSNPALSALRVVTVTADVESLGASGELGFDGIILKPITPEKLRMVLAS